MNTFDEEEALATNRCCVVCKHCFYTGLPGAYGCDYHLFVDIYDSCDKWELRKIDDAAG